LAHPPVNLTIVSAQAPTDAHLGDPFEITAFIQSEGLNGRNAHVELLSRSEGETAEPILIESREIVLGDDGVPQEVKFQQNPATAGSVEYLLRAKPAMKTAELSDADNERRKTIRPQTARQKSCSLPVGHAITCWCETVFRHTAIELTSFADGRPGTAVSQDSQRLLLTLSRGKSSLHDVIIAFDPDWQRVTPEQQATLRECVFAVGRLILAGMSTRLPASGGEKSKPCRNSARDAQFAGADVLAESSGP
jgi:hypothetical protein